MDTVEFNVCDNVKTFLMPINIGDLKTADSVYSARLYLSWDTTAIDLEYLVITSTSTLGYQFSEKNVQHDSVSMVIEMGTPTTDAVPVVGTGKPLCYLKGSVKASADVIGGNYGWIRVLSMVVDNHPVNIESAGMVRVVRDTTPAYTGALSISAATFDTARVDTVTLTVANLKNRRVNEVEFAVGLDTSYAAFVDTITAGTIAGQGIWSTKDIHVTADSVWGTLVAQSNLATDGALLKLVLRRKTDSAFASAFTVKRFVVNDRSCLGKLVTQSGEMTAKAIRKDSSSGVAEDRVRSGSEAIRVIPELADASLRIETGGEFGGEVMIFDVTGRMLLRQQGERIGASTLRVRFSEVPPSGIYFVGLRGRNEIVYKQFTIKK